MIKQNLEQKVGLMEKLRGVAGKTVGVYALTLAFGGLLGGCEDEGDGGSGNSSSGCTHNVGGRAGYAESGCGSGSTCECDYHETRGGGTVYSCSCVSNSPPGPKDY